MKKKESKKKISKQTKINKKKITLTFTVLVSKDFSLDYFRNIILLSNSREKYTNKLIKHK